MANFSALSEPQLFHKSPIPKDAAVLVVEDNVSNLGLIARMLGHPGIHYDPKEIIATALEGLRSMLGATQVQVTPWVLCASAQDSSAGIFHTSSDPGLRA